MMNLTRGRLTFGTALMAAALLMLSVVSAHAQSGPLMAKIPFGFYAGDILLPAGEYRIVPIENGVMNVFNLDTHTPAIFNTFTVRNLGLEPIPGKLVFHRYGRDYFLSEMWWAGQSVGSKTMSSKREREQAKTAAPARIESVAHR